MVAGEWLRDCLRGLGGTLLARKFVATGSGEGKIVCVSVVIVEVVVVVVVVFVMVVWLCGVPYRGCEDMVIEFQIKDKIVGDVTGHMINITL